MARVAEAALGSPASSSAVATIALQRKLPHRRMLELTGVLILAVLVMMVGKTVQVCQVVGWLPVHAVDGVQAPYWSGAWFGVFPTWEGFAAQGLAVVLVLGSYFAAERLRAQRRRRILEPAGSSTARPCSRPGARTRRDARVKDAGFGLRPARRRQARRGGG